MTKSEIDRLGDRLRKETPDDKDLRLLDKYRRSFSDPYENVVGVIRQLGFEPTGRPAKSTTSIVEKLRRESIRLSQIQDIAGCRLIVSDIVAQTQAVDKLAGGYDRRDIIDRRAQPSHGYRAVHMVVISLERRIEIQVRTALQHLWAELSEKLSDIVDPAIKYGGGPPSKRAPLDSLARIIALLEEVEQSIWELEQTPERYSENAKSALPKLQAALPRVRADLEQAIHLMIENPDTI